MTTVAEQHVLTEASSPLAGPAARPSRLTRGKVTVGAYIALTKPRIIELLLVTTALPKSVSLCSPCGSGGESLLSKFPDVST